MAKLIYRPAEDETVDPEYIVARDDGTPTNLTIQVATAYRAGFVLNEHAPEDTPLDQFWTRDISTHATLPGAKIAAEAYLHALDEKRIAPFPA